MIPKEVFSGLEIFQSADMVDDHTGLYLVRLFAFLLILGAIVDKNRSNPQPPA